MAVSGKFKRDKTGNTYIQNRSDADGEASLALLKMAGIDTSKVAYVAPGKSLKDHIHFDTGNKHGVVASLDDMTAYIDHHGEGSKNDTSSTEITYEALVGLGLLEKTRGLDQAVRLITQEDNRSFPNEEKYFKDHWHHTILGLLQFVKFPDLVKYFEQGKKPTDILNASELEDLGLTKKSEEVRKRVQASLDSMREIKDEGFIVHSEKYGDIAIDIGKKVNIGFLSARAMGMDGYVIWSPKSGSFFVSTKKPLDIKLAQGTKIRETMWIKPSRDVDGKALNISLNDIVAALGGNSDKNIGEGLKRFLQRKNKAA